MEVDDSITIYIYIYIYISNNYIERKFWLVFFDWDGEL